MLRTPIAALICALLALSCTDSGESVTSEFDKSNTPLTITVHVYSTDGAVTRAYRDFMGEELKDDPQSRKTRAGWTEWSGGGRCAIHVTDIKNMNDNDRFETWGHELKHCISGRYHK